MNTDFSYTKRGQILRIDHIEPREPVVWVPEEIEGCPVTELGDYVLAGTGVEELHLPMELRKIGAYGFYNCEKLRRIYCGSRIRDLGAGLFAGTGAINFLDFRLYAGERSCLKELLSELRQTLRVRLHLWEGKKEEAEARLIFPEYFEESVENTPARILYIETHGCGHRYRYCFSGTQFQYRSYDELFSHVKVQEQEELVTELALGRLQHPLGLTRENEEIYRRYVAEHWRTAGRLLLEADRQTGRTDRNLDPEGLPWLVQEVLERDCREREEAETALEGMEERLAELTRMAQQIKDTGMVAWLMDYRHRSRPEKNPGREAAEKAPKRRRRLEL